MLLPADFSFEKLVEPCSLYLGIKPKITCMLGKASPTEPQPRSQRLILGFRWLCVHRLTPQFLVF